MRWWIRRLAWRRRSRMRSRQSGASRVERIRTGIFARAWRWPIGRSRRTPGTHSRFQCGGVSCSRVRSRRRRRTRRGRRRGRRARPSRQLSRRTRCSRVPVGRRFWRRGGSGEWRRVAPGCVVSMVPPRAGHRGHRQRRGRAGRVPIWLGCEDDLRTRREVRG